VTLSDTQDTTQYCATYKEIRKCVILYNPVRLQKIHATDPEYTRIVEKTKAEKQKQAKQEDRKAKKAEEKAVKKDELGENRGNKIQEHTKRTRSHKGDEEKKPAAKKSNYLVEKNRASGKDGSFAPLLLRAPNSQSGRQIFRKFFNS
jgi:hypothetical protein